MRGATFRQTRSRALSGGLALLLGLGACDDEVEQAEPTAAGIEVVRGSVEIADHAIVRDARVGLDGLVETGADGRARARWDEGATALLDTSTRLTVKDASSASIERGRAFFDVPPGEPFVLTTPEGELRFVDAELAVSATSTGVRVNVVRGSVAHRKGQRRGVVGSGRRLTLTSSAARVEPETMWEDWTGGLASPGPRDPREAAGVGVLEGRRPGDVGEARWPLVVRTLDVHVKVVGDLAITEVEQAFFNPASETLEGLYRIRVPSSAVLHRFAVDRDGRMVDGYVREKRDAAAAYQAQVYAGSTLDPALLEWDSPGAYRARIHPIRPGESRRIAIRYSEWLPRGADGARAYRFPMGGGEDAPTVEALAIDVDLGSADYDGVRASHGARLSGSNVRLRQSDVRPRADFVMELEGDEQRATGYRAEHVDPLRDPSAARPVGEESDYFYLPLVIDPPGRAASPDAPIDLVVVADLSAATDRSRLELGRTVIEAIAAQLREGDRIAVLGGDLTLRTLGGSATLGPASTERVRGLLDALARAPAGGASDLGGVLTEAAGLLDPARNGSVVYVGDGAPTVGELGAGPLLERIARLPSPLRTFAVAVGDDANAELLASITRGSGLVTRVTTRAEAADAALTLVSTATRPVISRITVQLGTGLDRTYPREATSTTLGMPIPIVARIRGAVPSSVKVSGVFNGRPFQQRVPIDVQALEDQGDLRLRWATARLDRLLLDGARRTEIVDLGVRSGVITPFTSLYVPSAAELASMGPLANPLIRVVRREPELLDESISPALVWPLAPLLSLGGCSQAKMDSAPAGADMPMAEQSARDSNRGEAEASGGSGQRAADAPPPPPSAPSFAAPVVAAPPASTTTATNEPMDALRAREAPEPSPAPTGENAMGALGHGEAEMRNDRGLGGDDRRSNYGSGGGGYGQAAQQPSPDQAATRQPMRAHRAAAHEANMFGGRLADGDIGNTERELVAAAHAAVALDTSITVTATLASHARRSCSDATGMMLESRAALWRERLSNAYDSAEWARIYERAVASCEAPTARDRRKLLDLIIERAGDIGTMVQTYHSFVSSGARIYLRRAIFRRVRTPDELRIVRSAFGTNTVDAALLGTELGRATDDAGKIRVLRRLIQRFEGDLELSMQLLTMYERVNRRDDAKQLALVIRGNPLCDAGMRTAIGEMFLRMGDEPEARRTFSEIVEFAPGDELARRRLGDLYRAHAWYDDAYRQYQTLATLRPDDSTVLLLLAQAAAGAGRVDEALRLEQRLAETAPPGGAEGPARTAILWSSVRLAELRSQARAHGDQAQLRAYLGAMRRGGVLREAGDLRATLVWSHPDADLSLYASHPGLSLSRPNDISPELGLEAFDVREREAGTYRVEVRRGTRDSLTTVEAQLVVVFREGRADERIVILPIRFERGTARHTFRIEGDAVTEFANTEVTR